MKIKKSYGLTAKVTHQALHVLRCKLRLAVFFALRKCHIERLVPDDLVIHFHNSLGRVVWLLKTNKAKSLGAVVLIAHDL